jgi:hypothetical protein
MTATYQPRDWLKAFRIYLAVSAALHLIWEVLQLPLYTLWRTATARDIAFATLHCTAGDVLIAALSLIAALLIAGHSSWPDERVQHVFVAAVIIGLGYTIYSEWVNTVVRQSWAYSELMPTLPVLGTGLSPMLQWLVVPSLALYFASGHTRSVMPRAITP